MIWIVKHSMADKSNTSNDSSIVGNNNSITSVSMGKSNMSRHNSVESVDSTRSSSQSSSGTSSSASSNSSFASEDSSDEEEENLISILKKETMSNSNVPTSKNSAAASNQSVRPALPKSLSTGSSLSSVGDQIHHKRVKPGKMKAKSFKSLCSIPEDRQTPITRLNFHCSPELWRRDQELQSHHPYYNQPPSPSSATSDFDLDFTGVPLEEEPIFHRSPVSLANGYRPTSALAASVTSITSDFKDGCNTDPNVSLEPPCHWPSEDGTWTCVAGGYESNPTCRSLSCDSLSRENRNGKPYEGPKERAENTEPPGSKLQESPKQHQVSDSLISTTTKNMISPEKVKSLVTSELTSMLSEWYSRMILWMLAIISFVVRCLLVVMGLFSLLLLVVFISQNNYG